ncbi:MAG: 3-hydroxybutyrate dehydrogenase [Geminicoccaceae bacterium]|nr:3-hydroxybutyrate dehydrogenase [Geminicoccaceae bacterium]
MTTLKGKVALVTGSTSGIGRAIALSLAGEGADVVLNGFGEDEAIEGLKGEMAKAGAGRVLFDGANLTQPDAIGAMIRRIEREAGAIDVLVNNAGIQHTAVVQDFPTDRWDAIIALNLSACFHTIHHALPGMLDRGWGRIVNVASVHGLVASTRKAAYVAAKHGLVGLTKVVALETAETGVTCNAIGPGWVLTPLVQAQIDRRAKEENIPVAQAEHDLLAEKQPSKAFVTPEQLGALAVFLCGDAARQIRGQTLVVDGGWTAQ